MSKPAIAVEGLSKAYRIGLKQERFPTFRDALVNAAKAPLRRFRDWRTEAADREDAFWALKDVSFQVQPGEVVGIIGRNGAGKSTLLKILSRITEPTSGEARIRGRVASLLEVGTGFHPELTGRENIYLNGAILGMKRAEITRKFDEIVAFAETEKFLDTPVKFYSSGMFVRLAFAVAAHLEPEILIVDEVLAVGDAEFQKKCLGKMREVAKGQGRTVLFVSHNMAAMQQLCTCGLLLQSGVLSLDGSVADAVGTYLSAGVISSTDASLVDHPHRVTRAAFAHFRTIRIRGSSEDRGILYSGRPLIVEVDVACINALRSPCLSLSFHDSFGRRLFTVGSNLSRCELPNINGEGTVRCRIDYLPLAPGKYSITMGLTSANQTVDGIHDAISVAVAWKNAYGNGSEHLDVYGSVICPSSWTYSASPDQRIFGPPGLEKQT